MTPLRQRMTEDMQIRNLWPIRNVLTCSMSRNSSGTVANRLTY